MRPPPCASAGRGPLVRASIRAAAEAGRLLRVYAVEKNPAAVVHIQAMVDREGWGGMVGSYVGGGCGEVHWYMCVVPAACAGCFPATKPTD
jgi:hypothetical protein